MREDLHHVTTLHRIVVEVNARLTGRNLFPFRKVIRGDVAIHAHDNADSKPRKCLEVTGKFRHQDKIRPFSLDVCNIA